MLQGEILVGEFASINGLPTGAIVVREVATLEHEVRNDAMERRSFVSEPMLARAKRTEVFGRLGNDVCEEFEGDAASSLAVDVNVEENFRVSHDGCPYHSLARRCDDMNPKMKKKQPAAPHLHLHAILLTTHIA